MSHCYAKKSLSISVILGLRVVGALLPLPNLLRPCIGLVISSSRSNVTGENLTRLNDIWPSLADT